MLRHSQGNPQAQEQTAGYSGMVRSGQESADMKAERKAISKKLRFEVFKRDGFICQYCGAHPPTVILHVDHILAVAEGGKNNIDNLVTSCLSCNLGKGARSLQSIPQSLQEKALDIAEKEAQVRGYHEIIESRVNRIEQESWRVADVFNPNNSTDGYSRANFQSIKRFVEQLGVHDVVDSAEIAMEKGLRTDKKTFAYFCGVCWKRIRKTQDGAF